MADLKVNLLGRHYYPFLTAFLISLEGWKPEQQRKGTGNSDDIHASLIFSLPSISSYHRSGPARSDMKEERRE